jgi:hypothetical protein
MSISSNCQFSFPLKYYCWVSTGSTFIKPGNEGFSEEQGDAEAFPCCWLLSVQISGNEKAINELLVWHADLNFRHPAPKAGMLHWQNI